MPEKPDLRSRYKADALLKPPETADSDSSTVHADTKKILIRDVRSVERAILESQRYRLAWAEYDALKHDTRYKEMRHKPDIEEEVYRGQENKHRISDQRYMDLRENVDDNKLVQLYNKANPKLHLQRLALRDAMNMTRWDDSPPDTGHSVNDRFKEYMKEVLPKWKLTVHVPDNWSVVKTQVEGLILEHMNCTEHQNWALHPFREQSSGPQKALEKIERDEPRELRIFEARTAELRKKFDVERNLQKWRDEEVQKASSDEGRKEVEKYWNDVLRLQGVGSRVDVGYIPAIDHSKDSYERKRVPILEEDREAFPEL